MTTTTIAEFLTARLDEAESGWKTQRRAEADGCTQPVFHFGRPLAEEMLADIAAKRAIIQRYENACRHADDGGEDEAVRSEWGVIASTYEQVLCEHASVYADYANYQQEWKS